MTGIECLDGELLKWLLVALLRVDHEIESGRSPELRRLGARCGLKVYQEAGDVGFRFIAEPWLPRNVVVVFPLNGPHAELYIPPGTCDSSAPPPGPFFPEPFLERHIGTWTRGEEDPEGITPPGPEKPIG